MLKIIEVDGKQLEFEATLGTAELYEIMTGDNIFNIFAGAYAGGADRREQVLLLARLNDTYKKLAYIMNITATTRDDEPVNRIRAIKAKLTKDDYLAWLMQFKNGSMDADFFKQIAALWNAQQETHSEQKN